jgi:hypothetical protein
LGKKNPLKAAVSKPDGGLAHANGGADDNDTSIWFTTPKLGAGLFATNEFVLHM